MPKVYLSRRNLLSLLAKLDRVKTGGESQCTIIKQDDQHSKYPQSMKAIEVIAIEDETYYVDRAPGVIVEDYDVVIH